MGTVYLLGLDIGTGGCEGVFGRYTWQYKASLTTRHSISQPQPGAEHDPKNWWDEMVTIIKHCLTTSGINPKDIAGISPVALSPTFAPMRKVIQFVPLFFTGIIGQLWKPKS